MCALPFALGFAWSLSACSTSPGGSTPGDASVAVDAARESGVTDTGTTSDAPTSGCTGAACPQVRQLAAGYDFTLALLADGTVRCWGKNDEAQCGDGTTMVRSRPVSVTGLTGVAQVTAGGGHACARKTDGTVWCWGGGSFGRLGNGSTDNARTPVQVQGLTGATDVSAGYGHTCAVLTDGTARCWGNDSAGQLGRGALAPLGMRADARPAPVAGLTNIVTLALGEDHGCATTMDGVTRCWGSNSFAQLGIGSEGTDTSTPNPTPVAG